MSRIRKLSAYANSGWRRVDSVLAADLDYRLILAFVLGIFYNQLRLYREEWYQKSGSLPPYFWNRWFKGIWLGSPVYRSMIKHINGSICMSYGSLYIHARYLWFENMHTVNCSWRTLPPKIGSRYAPTTDSTRITCPGKLCPARYWTDWTPDVSPQIYYRVPETPCWNPTTFVSIVLGPFHARLKGV